MDYMLDGIVFTKEEKKTRLPLLDIFLIRRNINIVQTQIQWKANHRTITTQKTKNKDPIQMSHNTREHAEI